MTVQTTDSLDKWEKFGEKLPIALAVGGLCFGVWQASSFAMGWNTPQGLTKISGPNDPIAIAIGHAEGTRTCGGGKTKAYGAHKDPGDRKANRGTFSAAPRGNGITANMTPEEADISYIGNLNRHMEKDRFTGDRLAVANYYDLGVQAPATLGDYVKNIKAGQPIVQARINAFKRSDGSVDAAGFGHSLPRLTADQQRRFDRISECINGAKA